MKLKSNLFSRYVGIEHVGVEAVVGLFFPSKSCLDFWTQNLGEARRVGLFRRNTPLELEKNTFPWEVLPSTSGKLVVWGPFHGLGFESGTAKIP